LSGGVFYGLNDGGRKRGTPKVGMQDDAGGVDDRLKGRLKYAIGFRGNQFFDGIEIERCDGDLGAGGLRSGDLRSDCAQYFAEQQDELVASHALGKLSQTRAQ
jgi:hypothetical protein